MTSKRDSEETGDQVREFVGPARATTYDQAETGYRCTIDARKRFEELTNRDLMARAHATLKARGTYDTDKHGNADRYPPLTAREHLEILAAGEMLARYYRHPALIHHAVEAGASWPQIAAATGSHEAQVRQSYREWADGQHRLYADYQGQFGMDDADHAAAINRQPSRQPASTTRTGPGPGSPDRATSPRTSIAAVVTRPRRARHRSWRPEGEHGRPVQDRPAMPGARTRRDQDLCCSSTADPAGGNAAVTVGAGALHRQGSRLAGRSRARSRLKGRNS